MFRNCLVFGVVSLLSVSCLSDQQETEEYEVLEEIGPEERAITKKEWDLCCKICGRNQMKSVVVREFTNALICRCKTQEIAISSY